MKSLLILLLAVPAFAAEPQATEPERAVPAAPLPPRPLALPQVRESTLANGLRLAFAEARRVPVVGFEIILPLAGSARDPRNQAGLAAIVGELVRDGAGSLGQEDLQVVLEGIGVRIEAKTAEDATRLLVFGAKESMEEAMRLIAGAFRRPAIAQEDFERVRDEQVATAETGQENSAAAEQRVTARVYAGHPYGREQPEAEALRRLRLPDARALQAERLRPEGAAIVGAGDMRFDDFEGMVSRHFGSWRAARPQAAVPAVAPVPVAAAAQPPAGPVPGLVIELIHAPDAGQSSIRAGMPAVARAHPDYPAVRMMNYLLRERINANLRERRGWTYTPQAEYNALAQGGAVLIKADVQTDKTAAAIQEIRAELAHMQTTLAAAADLEEARAWYRANARKLPKVQDAAERMGESVVNGTPVTDLTGALDAIVAVTAEQVRDAARRYLRPDAMELVVAGDAAVVAGGLRAIGTVRFIDVHGREVARPATAAGR